MSWLLCQYMISQVQATKAWRSCFSTPSVIWESWRGGAQIPFFVKKLRNLTFIFVPASKVLIWVPKSCPFNSLEGEMLWKSKVLVPFAWFCCILWFFSLGLWGLWLWRKRGTSSVNQKSFFSHFGCVTLFPLKSSEMLNLPNRPLKCSTFIWQLAECYHSAGYNYMLQIAFQLHC